MKRRLVRICVFLVLGAIVNVAVAWGGTIRSHYVRDNRWESFSPEAADAAWNRLALPGWSATSADANYQDNWLTRWVSVNAGLWSANTTVGHPVTVSQYVVNECSAGWPFVGLRYVLRIDNTKPKWIRWEGRLKVPLEIHANSVFLPTQAIWPGFAINTAFYAAILWGMFAAPFALRRSSRRWRGLCAKCGYDLRGGRGADSTAGGPDAVATCPECGATR